MGYQRGIVQLAVSNRNSEEIFGLEVDTGDCYLGYCKSLSKDKIERENVECEADHVHFLLVI